MSRICIPVIVFIGVPLFLLSFFRIDVFTYKDSNKLERIIMTTKEENLTEQYPSYPEAMAKDERLQYKEGVTGLGMYAVNQIKDRLKSKEGENGASNSQQANIPRRPHSVGKNPVAEGAPQAVEVAENQSVGTRMGSDMMHDNYVPQLNIQPIPRVFENPESILTGSFSVDPLRPEHINRKELREDLLSVVAQFDLLAIQGMYTKDMKMFAEITEELSLRTGRPYQFVAHIPSTMSMNRPVPVFFYDSNALEAESKTVQLVCRPNDPFTFPPLAVKFRVKKALPESAFTFVAVNMQNYPNYEVQEMNHIPQLISSLKDRVSEGNFNREDDVIIFGYFGVEPRQTIVADARFNETLTWANPDYPTNTFGTFSYVAENILFQSEPLAEYQNNSGIWDLRRQFRRATKIPFDHHPVWACFSIYEGGKAPQQVQ